MKGFAYERLSEIKLLNPSNLLARRTKEETGKEAFPIFDFHMRIIKRYSRLYVHISQAKQSRACTYVLENIFIGSLPLLGMESEGTFKNVGIAN